MTNTVNIPERTLAQICDSTNAINVVGNSSGNRASVYQPHVVRVTDHADNDTGEEADDTSQMAIFKSSRLGEPWVKDQGLKHIIYKSGLAADGAATAVMAANAVDTVTVTDGGTNYQNPAITFTGGGGSDAAATATVVEGVITAITVTNGGSSYETTPTVVITERCPTDATVIFPNFDYSTFE